MPTSYIRPFQCLEETHDASQSGFFRCPVSIAGGVYKKLLFATMLLVMGTRMTKSHRSIIQASDRVTLRSLLIAGKLREDFDERAM